MTEKQRTILPKFQRQKVLADFGSFYSVEMPVEDWVAVEGHPRQRDTERQARKAHWAAARSATGPALAALRSVVAAELEGRRFKVDGHTRAHLWSYGELPDPGTVMATIYRCTSQQELLDLYEAFDSSLAAKKKFDDVSGAYRENGLQLTSKRLRDGLITDALGIAWRGVARSNEVRRAGLEELDVGEVVKCFAPELKLLDSIQPPNSIFYSGVLAAALLALALDPQAIEFFKQLIKPQAHDSKPGYLPPVEALLAQIGQLKGLGSARIKEHNEDLSGQTLSALAAWRRGADDPAYWISGALEPLPLQAVIEEVHARKQVTQPSAS